MGDLFAEAAASRQAENAPLAVRLRPSRLEDLVGQRRTVPFHDGFTRVDDLPIEADPGRVEDAS